MRRQLLFACLVALAATIAYLVRYERYTITFLYRMMRVPIDPQSGSVKVERLIKTLPPSDKYVVLTVPAKMGTTWIGHITHQLLTHGADFNTSVNLQYESPYPEFAPMTMGAELQALEPEYVRREPFASFPEGPITIRTHVPYSFLRKIGVDEEHGYRLATVLRDPKDTMLSFWRFAPGMTGLDPELIPKRSFLQLLNLLGMLDDLHVEIASAWTRRHNANMHLMFFDGLKSDLPGEVRRWAKFLRLKPEITEDELNRVISQCTLKFMSSPEVSNRFNEVPESFLKAVMSLIGLKLEDRMVTPPPLVRKDGGRTGDGSNQFPEDVVAMLDAKWMRHVQPMCNCSNMQEMVKLWQEEVKSMEEK